MKEYTKKITQCMNYRKFTMKLNATAMSVKCVEFASSKLKKKKGGEMNRRFECGIRLLERQLQAIDNPQTCGATINGDQRTILNKIKIRELQCMVPRIRELQLLVKDEFEQAWLDGINENVKARMDLIFKPALITN